MKAAISNMLNNGKLKPELAAATSAVLIATAYLETMRPTYDQACKDAIAKFKPVVEDCEVNQICDEGNIGKPIANVFELFKTSEQSASQIYAFIKDRLSAADFVTTNINHCAFLEAEHSVRTAKTLLIDTMYPYTSIKSEQLYTKRRDKFIDLTLNCLVKLAYDTGVSLDVNQPKPVSSA